MAKRYWVGGTGNWNDPAHWTASFVRFVARKTPAAFTNMTIDSIEGVIYPGMVVYVNNSALYPDVPDDTPPCLGVISFTGTGTGGVGTYSIAYPNKWIDPYLNVGPAPMNMHAVGVAGATVPTYEDDVYILEQWGPFRFYINAPPVSTGPTAISMKSLTVDGEVSVEVGRSYDPSIPGTLISPEHWNITAASFYVHGSLDYSGCIGRFIGRGTWYVGSSTSSQAYSIAGDESGRPYYDYEVVITSRSYITNLVIGHDHDTASYANASTCTWSIIGNVYVVGTTSLVAGTLKIPINGLLRTVAFKSTDITYSRTLLFEGGIISIAHYSSYFWAYPPSVSSLGAEFKVLPTNFTCSGPGSILGEYHTTIAGGAAYPDVTVKISDLHTLTIKDDNQFFDLDWYYSRIKLGESTAKIEFAVGSTTTVTKFSLKGTGISPNVRITTINMDLGYFNLQTTAQSIQTEYIDIANSHVSPPGAWTALRSYGNGNTSGWNIYSYLGDVNKSLAPLVATSSLYAVNNVNVSVTLGDLPLQSETTKPGPKIVVLKETAFLREREPRSSVAFYLREIAGPLPEYLTSKTIVSLRDQMVIHGAATLDTYPFILDTTVIHDMTSALVRRFAAVTETTKIFSRALGVRRIGESVREIAQIRGDFAYNNDVVVRDLASFSTNIYPITRTRAVLRETAKLRGALAPPATVAIREVALVTSRAIPSVVYRFVWRESAFLSSVSSLALTAASTITEAAILSSRSRIIQYLETGLKEVCFVSNDVVLPMVINLPGGNGSSSSSSSSSSSNGRGDSGEGTLGTSMAYTCSIASWGMTVLTNGKGSYITTNKIDLGTSQFKRPSAVYVNGMVTAQPEDVEGVTGRLAVTVSGDCDGAPVVGKYPLELRDQTDNRNNRVLIGKGFRSRYLQLKIGGTDVKFMLTSAEIDVAVSNRRV